MATLADLAGIAKAGIHNPLEAEAEAQWEKMTKMAEQDPDAYDTYVQEMMETARREQEDMERNKPAPAICTERWAKENDAGSTSLLDSDIGLKSIKVDSAEPRRCIVSICGSQKVPPLSSTRDGSVPIVLRPPVEPAEQPSRLILWQAVFHPGVILKAKRHKDFALELRALCWACVADKHPKLKLLGRDHGEELTGEAAEQMHRLAMGDQVQQ
eukprot:SAG31_NODE_217_length_19988_cov_53.300820_1_plen_213_part_00